MPTACGSSGWRLVFNDEPDAWGTQHDPVFDVAEVRLDYSQARAADDSFRAMSASVVMTTAEQGRFVLVWGAARVDGRLHGRATTQCRSSRRGDTQWKRLRQGPPEAAL